MRNVKKIYIFLSCALEAGEGKEIIRKKLHLITSIVKRTTKFSGAPSAASYLSAGLSRIRGEGDPNSYKMTHVRELALNDEKIDRNLIPPVENVPFYEYTCIRVATSLPGIL